MRSFIKRILFRNYWFYKSIVREGDDLMAYIYASLLLSLFGGFLFIGSIMVFAQFMNYPLLTKTVYIALILTILGAGTFFLYKKKEVLKKQAEDFNDRFSIKDLLVLLFIFFSCYIFFKGMSNL